MKIIRRHIWGIIQVIVSVLFVIKWLSKPVNIGPFGQDNVALYLLLTVVVTIISLKSYLNFKRENFEKLTPVFIFILTIIVIAIGSTINKNIEKNKKPIIVARHARETIVLFADSTYQFMHAEAEFIHYDRGSYNKQANKITLDQQIFAWGGETNTFYISDTSLYIITTANTEFFRLAANREWIQGKTNASSQRLGHSDDESQNTSVVENSNFKIYPNPSSGIFYYQVLSDELQDATLEVYDLTGKRIISGALSSNNANGYIDLSSVTNGIYFVKIANAQKILFNTKLNVVK